MIDSTAVSISGASSCGSRRKLDLIGSNPRDIQEVINESHELLHLTLNYVTGACRSDRRCAALQTLKCEANRRERIPELVRERCQKFVLTLIGFHEFGRAVTNPLFQLAVQCVSLVLGSLETLDEILIVESQLRTRMQSRDGIATSS